MPFGASFGKNRKPSQITIQADRAREHVDPGTRADPEKKALLGAATKVIHLTRHIGTELHGIQLAHLTDKQKDELGLLIAERSVVFFRDQDITPQQQRELGEWYGEIEVHPQVPQVPGSAGKLEPFRRSSPKAHPNPRCDRDVARPSDQRRTEGELPPTRRSLWLAYRSRP